MSTYQAVKNMYKHFELGDVEGPPHLVDDATAVFRLEALYEEVNELNEAMHDKNLPAIADALVDTIVFALGTAALYGLPFGELFDEVMQANMMKVQGPGIKMRGVGLPDLLKPEDWRPPNIEMVLIQNGWKPSKSSNEG